MWGLLSTPQLCPVARIVTRCALPIAAPRPRRQRALHVAGCRVGDAPAGGAPAVSASCPLAAACWVGWLVRAAVLHACVPSAHPQPVVLKHLSAGCILVQRVLQAAGHELLPSEHQLRVSCCPTEGHACNTGPMCGPHSPTTCRPQPLLPSLQGSCFAIPSFIMRVPWSFLEATIW